MECVPPKEFAKHAGKEFTCQKCGPVLFERLCDVSKRNIALEKRKDLITCIVLAFARKSTRRRDNLHAMPNAETDWRLPRDRGADYGTYAQNCRVGKQQDGLPVVQK